MKVALVLYKDGKTRDFPLSAATTVLGRKSECGLRIPTADVSRRHCEVAVAGEKVVVRDLGSANGTYVNGQRVAEADISPGDEIRVGPATFTVRINGKPAEIGPPKHTPPEHEEAKPAAVGEDSDVFELDEDDLFGSDSDSDSSDSFDVLSAIELIDEDEDEETKAR
jgi:predicted component of type VI protein secretion system